jgi:hypothetical protein
MCGANKKDATAIPYASASWSNCPLRISILLILNGFAITQLIG